MPFFAALSPDSLSGDIYAYNPEAWEHWKRFSEAVMRGPSPLTPGQRELIAAYVSALNACDYCFGGHRAAAEVFGVDVSALDALVDDPDSAPVQPAMRPLFAFVRKLTLTPARMTRADADAVYAAGWSERALHDAIAVAARYAFMNRLVDGHGIEAHPEAYDARGRAHAERGYGPRDD